MAPLVFHHMAMLQPCHLSTIIIHGLNGSTYHEHLEAKICTSMVNYSAGFRTFPAPHHQQDVRHRPPVRVAPPRHGRHEEHEARQRPGLLPAPHLRPQAGHRQRRQVHRCRGRHRGSRRVRSWYRLRVRIPHHRIRQEPLPQAAALLLCYSW